MASVRRQAQGATCLSNIKQIGLALQAYTQDYDGAYPSVLAAPFENKVAHAHDGVLWGDAISSYTKAGEHYGDYNKR